MSVPASYYPAQADYQLSAPVDSVSRVGVGKALGNYFTKAFTFTGRASRIEFWVPWLVILIPLFAVRVVLWLGLERFPEWMYVVHDAEYGSFVSIEWIVWFILLFPFLSLSIRRMRDSVAPTGLIVIPFILTALSLVFLVIEFWYYFEWFSENNALGLVGLLLVEVVLQTGVIQNYGFFEVVLEIVKYGINDMGGWYLMFIVFCALTNILLLIFMLLSSRADDESLKASNANVWGQSPMQAQNYLQGTPASAVFSGVTQTVSPDAVDPILVELSDNQTSALRLREIASQTANNFRYRDRLLAHPNMYPELAQWLRSLP